MLIEPVKTGGIIGAGVVGNGIAHVFARAGYKVIVHDVEQCLLDRALETISKALDRELKKTKITENDKSETLARILPATSTQALAAAHFVIEAVPERLDLKVHL